MKRIAEVNQKFCCEYH